MNLIDRYILKQFIFTLVFAIVALCVIFLVVNLLENLDDFMDNDATFMVIAKYYIHYFPEILKILTPVATLLSTLFTVGKLSTLNEITAMKTGGMSLYRIMIPLTIVGLAISFGQLYFNGWVVPKSNTKKLAIEREYLKKSKSGGPIYNLFLRDAPRKNVSFGYYNADMKTGHKIAIEYYSDKFQPRLLKRIEADTLKWINSEKKWYMINGFERTYNDNDINIRSFGREVIDLNVKHNQIVQLNKSVSEMNLDEFRNYIKLLKSGGKDVRKQMIEYYGEYAFPYANLIVILFGVPFASIRKKGGIAVQIGAAMVISFTYMIFIKFSQTIGYSMGIEPVIAAWIANIFFFILGLFTIFNTKT